MAALKISLPRFTQRNGFASERLAPIRAEVFGVSRLQAYARALAQQDQIAVRPRQSGRLFRRLSSNRALLTAAQKRFSLVARAGRPLSPAAEWLLDNFYIVGEQLRLIEQDLSHGYYHELPKLANGNYAGYPRVYGIALEIIAHSDSHLDRDVITSFVQAYQTVTLLSSGELWGVPIMLRLGLVENLRRLVEQSMLAQDKREAADKWAEAFLRSPQRASAETLADLRALAKDHAQLDNIFTVNLLQRLRDEDPSVVPVLHFLEQRLHDEGASVDSIVRAEHLRRATNRVSVGNVISSMRILSIIDWPVFFDSCSAIERTLRDDPAGVYPRMEFATRDQYRHEVERIAKRAYIAMGVAVQGAQADREQAVARATVRLAREWRESQPEASAEAPAAHVGY